MRKKPWIKRSLFTISLICLLAGCSVEGKVANEGMNKHMVCTDTRDGEIFGYNTKTVSDIRVGILTDTSFDIVDDNGEKRTLKSSMENYLKCKEAS